MDKIVTVSIINDYSVIVEGVARMLEHDTRINVVELADVANLGEPVDVALYDSFASMSRASHLKHLCEDPRFSRVVVYSFRADPQIIAAALAIGADGYITKDTDARTLAETLVRVANGERVVQVRGVKPEPGEVQEAAIPLMRNRRPHTLWPGQRNGLTPREAEIFALITQGLTNQEIAENCNISMNSVKTYIRQAYRKVGVERRSQAVLWGAKNGLLPSTEHALIVNE